MVGYCCINLSINKDKPKRDHIQVNRGMVKKTFDSRGLEYVSELAIKNISDLEKIIRWNIKNEIFVYRMSSEMFPVLGFYKLEDIPKFKFISNKLESIGNLIKSNSMRVSFHPSHFCVLASENEEVVKNTIDELNKHAQIMDIMGLDRTHYYPINIHISTTKPSRESACERFIENFKYLSDSCKMRLTLENDDSPNQYSVKILYDLIYKNIGVPIVFDQHHYNYGLKDQTMEESLKLAYSTWGDIKPLTHMSSPKTIEDPKSKKIAHADFIYERIETFGLDFDTEIEAKAKDLAVIDYLKKFKNKNE
jgi:UV DNA damage endonuclease